MDTGLFERDFLKNVLDAGAGDYFDVMNFHYYPFEHNRIAWVTDTNASGLREKFDNVKAELVAHGLNNMPYMITELGWHSNVNEKYPSTPEYQARRVPELLSQAMSIGSQVTIWWTFYDERQDFAYQTGLTTADDNPNAKLSYTAYQEALRRLGNSEYIGVTVEPTAQNDLEAYQFRDKSTNKTFYVAWLNPVVPFDKAAELTYDNSVTQNLSIPGSNATLFAKEGTQLQTVNDGDDGASDNTITVTVGRSPIYIVIN